MQKDNKIKSRVYRDGAVATAAFIINEEEFPWISLSCFGMFGKKCVTFIFQALRQQSEGLFIR